MKASDLIRVTEDASDYDMIKDATRNIYRKMRSAGLNDNDARHKIAGLLRVEADSIDYHK